MADGRGELHSTSNFIVGARQTSPSPVLYQSGVSAGLLDHHGLDPATRSPGEYALSSNLRKIRGVMGRDVSSPQDQGNMGYLRPCLNSPETQAQILKDIRLSAHTTLISP